MIIVNRDQDVLNNPRKINLGNNITLNFLNNFRKEMKEALANPDEESNKDKKDKEDKKDNDVKIFSGRINSENINRISQVGESKEINSINVDDGVNNDSNNNNNDTSNNNNSQSISKDDTSSNNTGVNEGIENNVTSGK